MAQNPIPAGYPSWNSFMELRVKSQEDCKEILSELEESLNGDEGQVSEEERKVALFYRAGMDEAAVEADGIAPLIPVLELCKQVARSKDSLDEFASLLGTMAKRYSIRPFFAIGSGPDKKNSEWSTAQIYQGGISLPDRDYYFDDDKEDKREEYKKFMAGLLSLLNECEGASGAQDVNELVDKIYHLELSLAKAHMTKTENRDPQTTYNKMTIDHLSEMCEHKFDFSSYLKAATGKSVDELGEVNVRNVQAIQCAAALAAEIDPEVLEGYLRWKTVCSCAPYLGSKFVQKHFEFYEGVLQGTKEMKPRWKRVMEFTESALGEALGKLYCAKYFDETSKERAYAIVEQVRQALEDRLKEVDWMKSEETRQAALKKMARFGVKIGYPDKWINYESLVLTNDEPFLSMVFKAREFENELAIKEMNAPTDRAKWHMTPQTVNAYYHPSLNEIVFPAAILQHPFFDKDADDAVNFGSMGAVIGHEMTHGFDDKGRKFDFEGNMVDWWSEEDGKEYEKRVKVMVDQAGKFEVHGQAVKGELTSGENIADLGGLRLALRALVNSKSYDPTSRIDGFSPVQRFFLSWAQCWRQNILQERALQLLTIDPHGPNELRCNGPLSNIPEFHEAFGVTENDPMFKPVECRVDIW